VGLIDDDEKVVLQMFARSFSYQTIIPICKILENIKKADHSNSYNMAFFVNYQGYMVTVPVYRTIGDTRKP
jgi:hypothetical protein